MKNICLMSVVLFSWVLSFSQVKSENKFFYKDGYLVTISPTKTYTKPVNYPGDHWFFEQYPSLLKNIDSPNDTLLALGGQPVDMQYYLTKAYIYSRVKLSDSTQEGYIDSLYLKYLDKGKVGDNKFGKFSFRVRPVKIVYFKKSMPLSDYLSGTSTSHTHSYLISSSKDNIDVVFPELIIYYPH